MKRAMICIFFIVMTTTLGAAGIELNSVIYTDGRTIDVTFAPTAVGPDAKIAASVNDKNGQGNIKLTHKNLQPAVLFSGDITTDFTRRDPSSRGISGENPQSVVWHSSHLLRFARC